MPLSAKVVEAKQLDVECLFWRFIAYC